MTQPPLKQFLYATLITLISVNCQPTPPSITILSTTILSDYERPKFRVCWSIYVGWMPWPYAEQAGILQKYADMYSIDIELIQVQSYMDSIIRFAAGDFDACTMTNGDALALPLVHNVLEGAWNNSNQLSTETTSLIIGSWSNGNDGIVSVNANTVSELKGKTIGLEQGTVSQFLLARALAKSNISLRDVTIKNVKMDQLIDSLHDNEVDAIVTWNPILQQALNQVKGSKLLFNSSQIPGEIVDLLVANKQRLSQYPQFGYALVQAWYEIIRLISQGQGHDVMAGLEGSTLEEFEGELASTKMIYIPVEAAQFFSSEMLIQSMSNALHYVYDRGYLDGVYNSTKEHGIYFPVGVMGDVNNIKLYFDDRYTKLAGGSQKK